MMFLQTLSEVDDGSMPTGSKILCVVIAVVIGWVVWRLIRHGGGRPPRR